MRGGEPMERNTVYDKGVVTLKFIHHLQIVFGLPDNESIDGHPYYSLGLGSVLFMNSGTRTGSRR